jgi:PhnB protein
MKRIRLFLLIPVLTHFGCATKMATSNKDLLKIQSRNNTQNTNKNMTTLTTYLLLDGNCKPAMEFYKSVFGGELTLTKVGESAMKDMMPPTMHDRVVNARLLSGSIDISASDWLRPNQKPIQGNTVCLYLSGGTFNELKVFFDKLSDGANITDPLKQEFFGTYGALNDKFGIRWMFQTDKK